MGWKAPIDDPFSPSPSPSAPLSPSPSPPRLAVVQRPDERAERQRFLSQLGVGWLAVLVALAVGAVLLVAQLGP